MRIAEKFCTHRRIILCAQKKNCLRNKIGHACGLLKVFGTYRIILRCPVRLI